YSLHNRDDQRELGRSFASGGNHLSGLWMGSYSQQKPYNRFIPWLSLFHGMRGIWWWTGAAGSFVTALTPDFTPLPYFTLACDEIREIKRGIGKLILNGKRNDDGIAILYSSACEYASKLDSTLTTEHESQVTFMRALEDLGLQYNFIADEQLAQGRLEDKHYRLLILPYSQALSDPEVKAVRRFARNGGLVVADYAPGVMDKHCKKLPESALSDLFGTGAKGIVTRQYGAGKGILLGGIFKRYFTYKTNARKQFGEVLRANGIVPLVSTGALGGGDPGPMETAVFTDGRCRYICLLRGVLLEESIVNPSDGAGSKDGKLVIALPDIGHVYDVRNGKYYGKTRQITTAMELGEAKVIALLPYEINGVSLETDRKQYLPGATVRYKVKVSVTPGSPERHVVRCELLAPDGRPVRWFGENLAVNGGECSGKLSLALNEQPGRWKFRATEIVSGKTGEIVFDLSPIKN
ncbi:MAG: beta-galactosidase trimerization domain-containing protein, partial [Victivallales bacterium]|nr:beta-galactosidase trimerization domain-containing protein [Victivallales bacterium]